MEYCLQVEINVTCKGFWSSWSYKPVNQVLLWHNARLYAALKVSSVLPYPSPSFYSISMASSSESTMTMYVPTPKTPSHIASRDNGLRVQTRPILWCRLEIGRYSPSKPSNHTLPDLLCLESQTNSSEACYWQTCLSRYPSSQAPHQLGYPVLIYSRYCMDTASKVARMG